MAVHMSCSNVINTFCWVSSGVLGDEYFFPCDSWSNYLDKLHPCPYEQSIVCVGLVCKCYMSLGAVKNVMN